MDNYSLVKQSITLPDGRTIELETGKMARQADGAVILKMGKTMLMATVVANKDAREDVDFLPLTVDYREKFSAAGRFPGGFFKREARPSDSEVLVSRLIDRALRPMFPSDFHAETQLLVSLISYEEEVMPDQLAGLAASAAIAVSDIPFDGPISEVRVARIDGNFIINPTKSQLALADIEMMVAGTLDSIVMVEGEMKEVSEDEMLEAIKIAHEAIKTQCQAQLDLAAQVAKAQTKREYCHETHDEELKAEIRAFAIDRVKEIAAQGIADKHERSRLFGAIKEDFIASKQEGELDGKSFLVRQYFSKVQKEGVREVILNQGKRLDGRKTTEVRNIWGEVDCIPTSHGSALFTRGETQSLTTLTLGSKLDEQSIDTVSNVGTEKFLLHYNFPPFSTGEARPMRGTSRREVGHGNLALRALKNMIPTGEENPYTIRLVSDILESNGSSSMATVCAGTMALMDAGIPIKRPVSGIAMGLITNEEASKWAILSDILGDEDHLGDMDFKITGTEAGITACQMDIKINGLNYDMLKEALYQAKDGRNHILDKVLEIIPETKSDKKEHAPRIISFEIPKDMIGAVIGPGGKIIQEIQAETNTTIVIEEVDNKGKIQIMANNKTDIDAAEAKVKSIALPKVVEVGEVYDGKVKSIMPYGAFVELVPGTDGLLHISELAWERVENVKDLFTEGDIVPIKVIGKEPKTGKLKLSRKVLLEKPEAKATEENA